VRADERANFRVGADSRDIVVNDGKGLDHTPLGILSMNSAVQEYYIGWCRLGS
jgi:hypothetical protein